MAIQFDGDNLRVPGNLSVGGVISPLRSRSAILAQEPLVEYPIPLTDFRVHDALQTPLPGTPATDDLGIAGNVFGTDAPYLTTGDLKAAGATTRRARVQFSMPPEYDPAETALVRISAGMLTTIADVSCTLDVEVYVIGRDRTIDGGDLYAGAAVTMNSLTVSDKDFALTSTSLLPGDQLDMRISIACNDAATATVVAGTIGAVELVCDIKG